MGKKASQKSKVKSQKCIGSETLLTCFSFHTTLARVWMSPQGCEGAIELLGEHGAREFVGISHRREGEQQVRASAPARWKAVGSADNEYKISGFAFRALNERGEGGGIEALAGWIETDRVGGGVFRPRIGACPQLGHFGFCVMRNA